MKNFLLLLVMVPFITRAQTKAIPGTTVKLKTSSNASIAPNPAPATASPNDGLTPDQRMWLSDWPDYYLETVKVTIHTGNDNKELPSTVIIGLFRNGGEWGDQPNSLGQLYNSNAHALNKQELKINGSNEFYLQSNFVRPTAKLYNDYNGYRWFALGLRYIQEFGLELHINYRPNFFADAWKVEKVTMTVQFKDILGRPHPTLGTKEIVFSQSKLLNNDNRSLVLKTDGFLFPKL